MPVGPRELSAQFYAHERMAFSSFGVKAWDAKGAKWLIYLSRVVEKTSAIAIAEVQDMMKHHLDLHNYSKLTWWSDGPRQFRSRPFISTLTKNTFDTYPTLQDISCNYGAPKRMKKAVDRMFGVLRGIFNRERLVTQLMEIEDVVQCYNKHFATMREKHPQDPEVFIKLFVPPPKSDIKMVSFKSEHFHSLQHGFCWRAHRNDKRRRNLASRNDFTHLSGITFFACGFSDRPALPEHRSQPVLDLEVHCLTLKQNKFCTASGKQHLLPARCKNLHCCVHLSLGMCLVLLERFFCVHLSLGMCHCAAKVEDKEADGVKESEMHCSTKNFEGWRTSFKNKDHVYTPEASKKRRNYLIHQNKVMQTWRHKAVKEPTRYKRTFAEKLERHRLTQQKKAHRMKEAQSFAKELAKGS